MPYYQRQQHLHRSMAAYHRLYHHLDLEFSICDDGSPDAVIAHGCKITTLSKKRGALNPCVPINRAVAASSADIIVITNPEIEHSTNVFDAMLEKLKPMTYVTAKCVQPDGFIEVPRRRKYDIPKNSGFHFCTMLTRELWELAGGFDEKYRHGQAYEDIDWLYTLESVGANFVMVDETVIHYPTVSQWPKFGLTNNKRYFRDKWNLS